MCLAVQGVQTATASNRWSESDNRRACKPWLAGWIILMYKQNLAVSLRHLLLKTALVGNTNLWLWFPFLGHIDSNRGYWIRIVNVFWSFPWNKKKLLGMILEHIHLFRWWARIKKGLPPILAWSHMYLFLDLLGEKTGNFHCLNKETWTECWLCTW